MEVTITRENASNVTAALLGSMLLVLTMSSTFVLFSLAFHLNKCSSKVDSTMIHSTAEQQTNAVKWPASNLVISGLNKIHNKEIFSSVEI